MAIVIEHNPRTWHWRVNGEDREQNKLMDLFARDNLNKHLFQGGVRRIWRATKSRGSYIALYEEEPRLRRITFKHKYYDRAGVEQYSHEEYKFYTPWMTYIVMATPAGASILYMYFSKGPVESDTHKLYFPALPNIYAENHTPGRVCNGAVKSNAVFRDGHIVWQDTIAGLVSDFWTSVYNEDILAFQDMNPFTIIRGLEDPVDEPVADPLYDPTPQIHHGMKMWETLSLEQVMEIPYHYLFNLKFILDKTSGEFGLQEENVGQVEYGSLFQKLAHRAERRR